jgi:peptidoglycan/LPS O-acetylase OafA/YrhL
MAVATIDAVVGDARAREDTRAVAGFNAPLEGLRGVAALWVLVFHYIVVRGARFEDPWVEALTACPALEVVVRNGYLGVDLFFVITGFLLALPWLRHARDGSPVPSALAFYRRRVRRILPAYYVQLLFLFFVCLPLVRGLLYLRYDAYFLAHNLFAHTFLAHYLSFYTSASLGLNGALWTLAIEAQYYLLLPLIAPWAARAPWRSAAAMLAIAVLWRWLAQHDMEALVRWQMEIGARWNVSEAKARHLLTTQLPGYLGHFAAGILCAHAWLAWRGKRVHGIAGAAWAAAAGVALGVLYVIHAPGGALPGGLTWLAVVAAIGVAMLALVARGLPAADALLANRPLAFTGRVSYSMYLYHLPLLAIWNQYVSARAGWLSFPLYLALTLLVAWLSWRWIEVPYQARGRK